MNISDKLRQVAHDLACLGFTVRITVYDDGKNPSAYVSHPDVENDCFHVNQDELVHLFDFFVRPVRDRIDTREGEFIIVHPDGSESKELG